MSSSIGVLNYVLKLVHLVQANEHFKHVSQISLNVEIFPHIYDTSSSKMCFASVSQNKVLTVCKRYTYDPKTKV